MKDLYIIGAGGLGREVSWIVERINESKKIWNIKGFIDDDIALKGKILDNYPVLGDCTYLENVKESYVVSAVAAPKPKRAIVEKIKNYDIKFATIIDPSAIIASSAGISEGSVIAPGCIVSIDALIGRHNIIEPGCTIGHDAILDDYCTLYPGVNVSGNTRCKEGCEIGTGTQLLQGLSIAKDARVGAGAVVNKNIEEAGTYVGVPAYRLTNDR